MSEEFLVIPNIRTDYRLQNRQFLIDCRYQGIGKGKQFMQSLMQHLSKEYSAKTLTTTYIWGNETAKNLYESLGFQQTDIVCEGDIHEVNLIFNYQNQ